VQGIDTELHYYLANDDTNLLDCFVTLPTVEANPNCTGLQKGSKKTSLGTPGKNLCMKPQVGTPNCRTSDNENSIFRYKPLVLTTTIKWKQCTTHENLEFLLMTHCLAPQQAFIYQPIHWPLRLIHIQKAFFFASIAFNTTRSHDQCYSILDIILDDTVPL